ncbi:MAG: alpha/beta hydrolase family protein [Woeseiaceae bacterium]
MLKVYYPALPDDSDEQRDAGIVPPDRSAAPYPLIVIMPGINVGPESYTWLATELALQGIVTVTYSLIAEEMPGYISLTPGLDLSAITPETYGTRPSGTVVAAIIDAVEDENAAGLLEGCVDTQRTILAGHSAGGSVALFNANPDWFPQVCGAIAYGAHAGASTALGFADNTILELSSDVPLLLIAGTNDGVIASSGHRYGDTDGDTVSRIVQTFEDGVLSDRGDSYLVEIQGANHFSLAYPVDETTGRHFLDGPEYGDSTRIRELLATLFAGFVHDVTGDARGRLAALENHELITTMRRR